MNSTTATPLMGLSASLLSLVSSALSVAYPTMMPVYIGLAEQINGIHVATLISAVAAGGALAGTSPMSTGGALILGGKLKEKFIKEYQSKVFVLLIIISSVGLVTLMLCAATFYGPHCQLALPARLKDPRIMVSSIYVEQCPIWDF